MRSWPVCIFACSALARLTASALETHSLQGTACVGVAPPKHQIFPSLMKYPSAQCLVHLWSRSVVCALTLSNALGRTV